uniref:(northern house mosquito) hypothetical protein n=1 Tax=Culex pipiens TaxID=7175 RepID=A0A8D8NLI0_CULPI
MGRTHARVPVQMAATNRTLHRRPSGEGIVHRRRRITTGRTSDIGCLGNRSGISTIGVVRQPGGVPVRSNGAVVTAGESHPREASHARARATTTVRRLRIEVVAGLGPGIGHAAAIGATPVEAGPDHRRVCPERRRSSTSRRRLRTPASSPS